MERGGKCLQKFSHPSPLLKQTNKQKSFQQSSPALKGKNVSTCEEQKLCILIM